MQLNDRLRAALEHGAGQNTDTLKVLVKDDIYKALSYYMSLEPGLELSITKDNGGYSVSIQARAKRLIKVGNMI